MDDSAEGKVAKREVWERQEGETNRAWAAFQIYRDMSPADRTLLGAYRVAKGPNKAIVCGTWKGWYEDWRWKERAEAYDVHVDEKARLALEQRRIEARKETAELGKGLRKLAQEALSVASGIMEIEEKKDGEEVTVVLPSLNPYQIARLASVGVNLERLALGEPQGSVDLTSGGRRIQFFLPEKEEDGRGGDE